ncbi:tRNA pseudouridine(55) synthase TruB [Sutcliffiella cohnii]
MNNLEGVLILNKPKGYTSHDCVFKIRKLLKTKKVGHTGTLDPEVTGVLPICIGNATKIVEYLTAEEKTYVAEVTLGRSTTTEDQTGETVDAVAIDRKITIEEIEDVTQKLIGEIDQTPPMYSAVKINGKKLYEYARQGIEIERPTRKVTIHHIEIVEAQNFYEIGDDVKFTIRVTCSKGTYIRTLAVTIGEKLGFPAHMSSLVRTQSGIFTLNDAITFEQLEEMVQLDNVHDALIPIEKALRGLPALTINDTVAEKVKNGAVLPLPEEMKDEELFVVYYEGKCLAIYMKHPTKEGLMKPRKVFHT